jgi:hypothetical protein
MARDASVSVGRALRLGLAVVTCGLLAGCGDSSGPSPGTPTAAATTPTPGPSPTPAPVSFLHLRHEGGDITTYQIDGITGRLDLAGTQRLGDVRALAGDPDGRYVYMAYVPQELSVNPREDASIALYEADASGSLIARSEAWSRPWELGHGYSCGNFGWTWLSATRDRVWGIWLSRFGGGCQHEAYTAVTHVAQAGGQLEPAARGDSWMDSGWATLDTGTDVLYKSRYGFGQYGPGALTAHGAEPDGRLRITGYSSLCVASQVSEVKPLTATRGLVFGSDYGEAAVCSWEGPRLAPRANLGFAASQGAASSPTDPTATTFLAMAGDVRTRQNVYERTDLRLLSMEGDGSVALLDTAELPSRVRQLLFHPSGRFLYVADEDDSLRTYLVSPGKRLEPIENMPDTARPSVGRDWPYYEAEPPFMAVSVRPGMPRL